jgi:hypothetical protein
MVRWWVLLLVLPLFYACIAKIVLDTVLGGS